MILRRTLSLLIVASSVVAGASVANSAATAPGSVDRGADVRRTAVREQLPRRATIISDSAMAGVRWNGALGGLRGFVADDRLESCRRLVDTSCRGREGRRPATALVEVTYLPPPAASDVLIIAVGYNDYDYKFPIHSRMVLNAAVAKGYQTIAWINYREDVNYTLPRDTNRAISNYRTMNAELRTIVASGAYPQLQLWDLNDYTRFASGWWFTSDGVHQLRVGSWGVADWISRKMAHISEQPCPMPWSRGWAQEQPCPDPNLVRPSQGYPGIVSLYEL